MDLDIVFSTNPDWKPQDEPKVETPEPCRQKLHVRMERKGRGGKQVTLVEGFVGNDEDLATLAKRLKTACGVGGSAKEGVIIIQGDHVQRVRDLLTKMGYK